MTLPIVELGNDGYQLWFDRDLPGWACGFELSPKQADDGRRLACLGQPNKVFCINKCSPFSISTDVGNNTVNSCVSPPAKFNVARKESFSIFLSLGELDRMELRMVNREKTSILIPFLSNKTSRYALHSDWEPLTARHVDAGQHQNHTPSNADEIKIAAASSSVQQDPVPHFSSLQKTAHSSKTKSPREYHRQHHFRGKSCPSITCLSSTSH